MKGIRIRRIGINIKPVVCKKIVEKLFGFMGIFLQ